MTPTTINPDRVSTSNKDWWDSKLRPNLVDMDMDRRFRKWKYDFGIGHLDPGECPVEGLKEAAIASAADWSDELVRYGDQRGYGPLRDAASERLNRFYDFEFPADRMTITNGSMQALTLLCEALVSPGETVLVEEYTYPGMYGALEKVGAQLVGVRGDEFGLDPADLERQLQSLRERGVDPKFLYIIPTFQNPTGSELSMDRRHAVVEIAQRSGLLIVEDDCYAELRFEGEPLPCLYQLNPDRTLYVSSFSKLVAPGIRMGYFLAPSDVLARIMSMKVDGGANTFTSLVLNRFLRSGFEDHLARLPALLAEKRDAAIDALQAHRNRFEGWSRPNGGVYLWLKLLASTDPIKILEKAQSRGVSYVPGSGCRWDRADGPFLRLSYAHLQGAEIRDGIAELAAAVEESST